MPVWCVTGGNKLNGSLTVQGAKNAVLPILAATLLGGVSKLENCPGLSDVEAAAEILRHLGCSVMQKRGEIVVDSRQICECSVPQSLMRKMRSSVIFMGAILARCGEVHLSRPGGCELGERPIDLHMQALRELGAEICEDNGEIVCRAAKLKGAEITLGFPSVGATENAMLAACAAEGETLLRNAAREPEIVDLQRFLNAKGGSVSGAGTNEIRIRGFCCRDEVSHRIMPDRIAAATYLCAAAAAGGDICLKAVTPSDFARVTEKLTDMGCRAEPGEHEIRLVSAGRLRSCCEAATEPFPGFPTDAQALLMSAALRADGRSVFRENIFENRFRHVAQMKKLGADINVSGSTALVRGVPVLHGAEVRSEDLRGGAALVLSGLAAEGVTTITGTEHIARGYEDLAGDLCSVGANIRILSGE